MENNNFLGNIRPIYDDELEIMLEWRNTPEIRNNMYTTNIISLENHLKWYQNIKNNPNMNYFMYVDAQNNPSGIIAFTDIDFKNNHAFWAFYANPIAQKGTGSKMEFLALDYAFNQLNLHKLNCEVLSHNHTVIKLHKKFGFIEEGIFRQQHIHENKYINIHRLGILKSEWEYQRKNMLELLRKLYNK